MVANRQFYHLRRPASLKHQSGIGWLGWITILLLVGMVGLFALRLVPIYLDYFQVQDVARSLARESGAAGKSKSELKTLVASRFRQNNIYKLKPTILKFAKSSQQRLIVHIDYEERVTLFGNIDILVTFNNKIYQN